MDTNKNTLYSNMVNAGKALALFAIIAGALVALTFQTTKTQISENERMALLKTLNSLVPTKEYNNDLHADQLSLDVESLNYRKKPITIFRARLNNQPVAAIFSVVAPDGYSGAINLLIAINYDKTLSGIRVVSHKETPGLGDAIDIEKSDWIKIFHLKSLTNPIEKNWRVKKDGGYFDQLTGATITPRAIVKIAKLTLQYFSENREKIFTSS